MHISKSEIQKEQLYVKWYQGYQYVIDMHISKGNSVGKIQYSVEEYCDELANHSILPIMQQ